MRLRTVALALALSCGLGTIAEAKKKPAIHKVSRKTRKTKRPKAAKRQKVKRFKHA